MKNDTLCHGNLPDARDRTVEALMVLVGTNRRLHHLEGKAPIVGYTADREMLVEQIR
jgi:hypothetical protein